MNKHFDEEFDVVVIGGGPSGAVSSAMLHDKGWSVKVVEKQQFPRFVIGESLLPRCMDHLEESGLMKYVEGLGFQEKKGARFERNGQICDFDFSEQFTKGSTWTWQVPRDEFDLALANGVIDKGVDLEYKCSVESIDFNSDFQYVEVKGSSSEVRIIKCKYIIDASGYGRVIPRMLGLDKPSSFPARTAVFAQVEYPLNHPTAHLIDIVSVTDTMWAWVIVFSDGRASIGFVGEDSCFESFGETATERWLGALGQSKFISGKVGEVKFKREAQEHTAYSIGVSKLHGEGFVLTGNTTEFLDPIFSSGVTFAMESGNMAAKLIDRQLRGEAVDWEKEYSQYLMKGVDTFRSYVTGWYDGRLPKIFYTEKTLEKFKTQICSVLAGYVWDDNNPFVKRHSKLITTLSKVVDILETADQPKSD